MQKDNAITNDSSTTIGPSPRPLCLCGKKNAPRRAFTLVEIMIAVVIVGLLASVVTINVRSYMLKAKQNIARQTLATTVNALETFYALNNRYPTNEEGLDVLCKPTEKDPEPLLDKFPIDPWGNPLQYNSTGKTYELICHSEDGPPIRADELQEKSNTK